MESGIVKRLIQVITWSILLFFLSLTYANLNEASAQDFKDVPKKHPNYVAIQEMQNKGLISGYPDGTFRPNENISRKHVAVLLDKALNFSTPPTEKLIFKDVPKSHPYYVPIMKLFNEGIISGGVNGKFNPDSPITRIQMAKILDLAFKFNMTQSFRFEDMNFVHWGYVHASALYSNGVTKGDQGRFLPNKPVTRAHYAEFLYRSMKIGTNPISDKISKDKAIDLSKRLPLIIEGIRIQAKRDKKTYNQMRIKQLPYATASLVDGLLKEDYPYVSTGGDSFLFPQLTIEPSLRFKYEQPDPNTLNAHTVELNGMISGSIFVDFYFKKESGIWKLDNFDSTYAGKKNFELTRSEAELILKDGYSYFPSSFFKITYISTTTEIGEDPETEQKYTFNQYKFIVEDDHGSSIVRVNSDDGLYY